MNGYDAPAYRDRLIDHADEAREARADLDARAIADRVFFTQAEKLRLTSIAIDPPSEFDLPPLRDENGQWIAEVTS